jgi:protoheme IX farnesyltransferase
MSVYLELTKIRIALFATLAALTGYVLAGSGLDGRIFSRLAAIFCLAAGALALNQCQESDFDAVMIRTSRRPIPSGRISRRAASWFAGCLLLGGCLGLLLGAGPKPLGWGLVTVILYNGVYTYLKRRTPFAAVPGALIGSITPLLGWSAAGGVGIPAPLAALMLFFFLWQIPHFWLLFLLFDREYQAAGFPVLTSIFREAQLIRIILSWTLAAVVAGLMLPLFGIISVGLFALPLGLTAIWLLSRVGRLWRQSSVPNLRQTYLALNFLAGIIMGLAMFEQICRQWSRF